MLLRFDAVVETDVERESWILLRLLDVDAER
jgi:hypothetical protein